MPTAKKKVSKPTRRRVRRRNGGGTIAQLKKWIEADFGRKFDHIARIVDRPRKGIIFKMWGPTMMYTIEAWEVSAKLPRDDVPRPYDGIIASCTQRYYQDGEDWHRGLDLSDGPLEKATWDRVSAEIRQHAIHSLPAVESSWWHMFNKGTTRDMVRAGIQLKVTPTLKGAQERRERLRKHGKTKKGRKVVGPDGVTRIELDSQPSKKAKKKAKKKTPKKKKALQSMREKHVHQKRYR